MVTVTSFLQIILTCFILKVVFSDGLPPSIKPSQTPTLFHHEILKPNSPYEELGKSRLRSPPPPASPPPPPSFDHFKLALTWPQTFCKIENCFYPLPQKFVIHGLWPNKVGDTDIRDCQVGKEEKTQKLNTIRKTLEKDWPSLIKDRHGNQNWANDVLWLKQWNSHGTCSIQMFEFLSYFEETLKVYNRYNIKDILEKSNIKPGEVFKQKEYIDALKKHINFTPQIRCEEIDHLYYLSEIRFCLTASKNLEYQDCANPYSGCNSKTKDVYF
ncbi:ribonuclease 3-like [Vicia villosa]|uniref:ribonuclease 3-like n=1 Tax=Vicia villosa TaxID=3911 RepID=UPI00273ADB0D|nr:ribonuclease 3-like [Vicia villosa]